MKSNVGALPKPCGIAGVVAAVDVPGHAGDAEFLADVGARPAAAARVKNQARLEVEKKVLDEVAAAVAGIGAVAIFAGAVEVIQDW